MANRVAVNLKFEHQKNKSKLRENQFIATISDKDKEIKILEKSIKDLNPERLQNPEEKLLQRLSNQDGKANENGQEDLQRLLGENKRIALEFETLTLEELKEKERVEHEKLLLNVEQLKKKLIKIQQDYEILDIEDSSKYEECGSLNNQLENASEELAVLEEKFSKLEMSRQDHQQPIWDIEAQYIAIKTKFEHLQTQYEQAESTRGQSLSDYQRLEKENLDLQTEIEILKKKMHDAQQILLESSAKYKETKTENQEYPSESSKLRQENEELKIQLLDIHTQFQNLQKEYEDLSIELMDNVQESDHVKVENSKLKDKLKDYEDRELAKGVAFSLCHHNSSMRCSGACVNKEEDVQSTQSLELLNKFCEFSEIEVTNKNDNTQLFETAAENSTTDNYKMGLKNVSNVNLQRFFTHHSFHIMRLHDEDKFCGTESDTIDMNGCEKSPEYIGNLKQVIIELKMIKEAIEQDRPHNRSLLESTERVLSKMKEQVTQLSIALLEKYILVEKCARKSYQQQIKNLKMGKADITIIFKELQDKISSTLNGSLLGNNCFPAAELIADLDDKLREIEQLKFREQYLSESYDPETKILEEIAQRCIDMEVDIQSTRDAVKNQENEFREKYCNLESENLQKREPSAKEYKSDRKKCIREWEESRDQYEQAIKDFRNQINVFRKEIRKAGLEVEIIPEELSYSKQPKTQIKKIHSEVGPEIATDNKNQDTIRPKEYVEDTNKNKCRFEEQKRSLEQQPKEEEELLARLKAENLTQCEEIIVFTTKINHLEELLADAKRLYETISEENSSLKFEINSIREEHNCLLDLRDKNQQLSDEMEQLQQENARLEDNLRKTEIQIQEFCQEERRREILIQTLQNKIAHLIEMEEEQNNLAKDFHNLREQYNQVQDNLQKAEQQIQSRREELIQTQQTKLGSMKAEVDEVEVEIEVLKAFPSCLKEKEVESSKEIKYIKQKVEILVKKVADIENTEGRLHLEKSDVEQKLKQTTGELNLLQNRNLPLETQLDSLTEERKSLVGTFSRLEKEKATLKQQLKEIKAKEVELAHTLRSTTETLQKAQNQLEEYKNLMLHDREEKVQTQQDLENKYKQLEGTETDKENIHQDNENLHLDMQTLKPEQQKHTENTEVCQQDKIQLKQALKNPQQEKEEQQLKQFSSKLVEEQQLKPEPEQQLKHLNRALPSFAEAPRETIDQNNCLQKELQATKESLTKLQQEHRGLQEKLMYYHNLQQDKNKLETTLIVLKRAQTGALNSLQEEKDKLLKTLQQYEEENNEYKEKEETLKHKIEFFYKEMKEMRCKVKSDETFSLEHDEMKNILTSVTAANEKLQQEISELTSQKDVYVSEIENLMSQIEKLSTMHKSQIDEKQMIQSKLLHLNESLQGDQVSLRKEHLRLKSSFEELQLKCNSLQLSNSQLEYLNQQLEQQYKTTKEKLKEFGGMQEELKTAKAQYRKVQRSLKKSIEAAGLCSLALQEDVDRHKQLLQKQMENYNSLKFEMEAKQLSLSKENVQMSATIDELKKEKCLLENNLRALTVGSLEYDMQHDAMNTTANLSLDSRFTHSPKERRSLERISADKASNKSIEEKLSSIQQKSTAAERKTRRLKTHDEGRRQLHWGAAYDRDPVTDS